MATGRADHFERTLPRLRAEFEASRHLVARARDRAEAAAEATRAMRKLLEAHAEGREDDRQHVRPDVWRAAAREIVRLTKERDRVLGLLSHELRQSLSAAIAAERVLATTADEANADRARNVLGRQLRHLSRLVEGLLDFSRASLGGLTIARETIDLRTILADAVDAIRPTIAEQHQQLIVRTPDDPQPISADPNRLVQVFVNLLQNASRYTPPEGHVVLSSMTEEAHACVTVEDSGSGIEAEALPHIFEPFVRGTSRGGGLGIGLALAARIVSLHGGTIAAASRGAGCGSLFTVTLPLGGPRAA